VKGKYTMDGVRLHFDEEAYEFDGLIVKLIPHYQQMLEALVLAIPFENTASVKVVDLGCGTGTVAQHVLRVFPNAQITCVDLAENMIAMARAKLGMYGTARYVVSDFQSFAFDGKYDVIVSSLALHHLATDIDKQSVYGQIYCGLRSGGVFYNADIVLGSNDFLQDRYMDQWQSFMGQNVSSKEIESKWIPKYRAEDRPAKLTDQLKWLTEIGFADVDVLWKHYNFAVYGGRRP
jgi:tRNA (cmo5U34)-methyltransferase